MRFLVVVAAPKGLLQVSAPCHVRWVEAASCEEAASTVKVERGGHAYIVDEGDVHRFATALVEWPFDAASAPLKANETCAGQPNGPREGTS